MSYYGDNPERAKLQAEVDKRAHLLMFVAAVLAVIAVTACVLGGIWINSYRAPVDTDVQITEQPR